MKGVARAKRRVSPTTRKNLVHAGGGPGCKEFKLS